MQRGGVTRRRWLVLLLSGVAVTLGLWFFGITPWLAVLVALLCLFLLLGQWMSWSGAIAGAIVALLFVGAVVLRATPALGWPLDVSAGLLLLCISVGAIVALSLVTSVRFPRRPQLLGGVGAVACLIAVTTGTLLGARGSDDYEWMMHNDAVWNVVTTRFVIDGGGLDSEQHPNSSPLTAILMAAVASVGRGEVSATALLAHDIARFAAFLLFLCAASCVLAGLIGYRGARTAGPRIRWAATLLVGVLPSTWFVFGVASGFGFFNATVVVVLLCAVWLLWIERNDRFVLPAIMLGLAAVCLLATWAPLAVIPLGLAAVKVLGAIRTGARGRAGWMRTLAPLLVFFPVAVYALFVTIPDLGRDGAALAVEGAFISFLPIHLALILVVALLVLLLMSERAGDAHALIGAMIVASSGLVALGYLVLQRRDAPSLWGYYPAKFAWFLATILLFVLAAEIASAIALFRGSRARTLLAGVLTVVVPIALMALIPPVQGWRTAVTPLAIAAKIGPGQASDAARHLFAVAENGVPTMVLNYGDASTDQFINSWLLQLEAESSQELIRNFSYFLVPGDEEQACEALLAWDRDVRVVTSDPALEARLADECSATRIRVEVRTNPDAA